MTVDASKKIMAANIKRYMKRKGVTNKQLCEDLGFKYTTFLDWTKGVTYPRIGKVEAMANYFGCEKSDLIEQKPTGAGGLSHNKKALIDFAKTVPDDRAALVLRVMQSILEDE